MMKRIYDWLDSLNDNIHDNWHGPWLTAFVVVWLVALVLPGWLEVAVSVGILAFMWWADPTIKLFGRVRWWMDEFNEAIEAQIEAGVDQPHADFESEDARMDAEELDEEPWSVTDEERAAIREILDRKDEAE